MGARQIAPYFYIRRRNEIHRMVCASLDVLLYSLCLELLCDWYDTGHPNLVELRNFLHEIASSAWVAVIGFIAKSFVDKDNDGIPDEYESEDDKKRSKEEL